ncbi:MAG: hypothetical protein JXQ77_02115, partial [Campylobacterales bacterium]|nr:hypothetical protein [Campylobacterales bacterium]
MFKKISLAFLLMIGNVVYADSDTIQKPWQVGVFGIATFENTSNNLLSNDFPGVGVHVGYHFAQNWSAVGEILYTTPDYSSKKVDVVDYIGSMNYN